MENLRRRTERDLESAHKFALEKFANDLLPVKDSLEMGLDASTQAGSNIEKVVEGMDVVDAIDKVKTTTKSGFNDVPAEPVMIKTIRLK